jgi:copper resistance protein D
VRSSFAEPCRTHRRCCCGGPYAYLATLVPGPLVGAAGSRLAPLRLAAIAVAVVATMAVLPLEAATFGDGWADAGDLTTLQNVVIDTSVGNSWIVQAIAAIALGLTNWSGPRYQHGTTALCAGLLLGCRALMGHAIMREGAMAELLQLNYLVHVLSAGAWLGALVPLLLVIQQLSTQHLQHNAAVVALQRFSTAGQGMVAAVVSTGVANTCLILGYLPLVWSQPYQQLLAMKISLVGAMIVIALVNRHVIVPRTKSGPTAATRQLLYATAAELVLGAGVLVLVNLFGTYDPG